MPALFLAGSLALAVGCDGGDEDDTGGGTGGDDRSATILGLEGDATAGATLFTSSGCSNDACHGADGVSGMAMPSLDTSVMASDDSQIVNTFLNGKGTMPPQSGLSDQALADLLAYVSDTFG
ncbi:MAG: c-type cytochrome [Nannocystales bacterium]